MTYYVVSYTGPFAYIKPWSAVRDGETYSQQFLTPSIVRGMEIKLGLRGHILGHRLRYAAMDVQQEQTRPRVIPLPRSRKKLEAGSRFSAKLNLGILNRGVLLWPELDLAFETEADARLAATQHICLCRNEDMLLPKSPCVAPTPAEEWANISGFELRFGEQIHAETEGAFLVGYNRFDEFSPMYGILDIIGTPVHTPELI